MEVASDLMVGIAGLFKLAWRIFMEVEVPGLGVSFGVFWIGVTFIYFSMRALFIMLGTHVVKPGEVDLPPPYSRPIGFRSK